MERIILDMTAPEARRFFLKQESFCNIGLPQYFNFQKMLDGLSAALEGKRYSYINQKQENKSDVCKKNPGNYQDVNYLFLKNKDGRFSWRPLQIINPVLYVCLVKEITEASMLDAVDYGYYRHYNEIRISKEKFVESFLRRFAESANLSATYQISFYDIYEAPPKVSVKVSSTSNSFRIFGDSDSFDMVNKVDSILELNPTLGTSTQE